MAEGIARLTRWRLAVGVLGNVGCAGRAVRGQRVS